MYKESAGGFWKPTLALLRGGWVLRGQVLQGNGVIYDELVWVLILPLIYGLGRLDFFIWLLDTLYLLKSGCRAGAAICRSGFASG